MPHLTIEFSANVAEHHDVDGMVSAIHDAVAELGVAPLAGMRTRAVEHARYRVADGDPVYGFVAMTARIGPGRTPDTKRLLIQTLLDSGEAFVAANTGSVVIAWSAEVQEIDADFRENRNHIAPHLATK